MKKGLVCVVFSVTIIVLMLLLSINIAAFADRNYYEKEYTKYAVHDDVKMQMSELMKVNDVMLDYLQFKRNDLVVEVEVDSNQREFFNDREKAHMYDVKRIFGFINTGLVVSAVICSMIVFFCHNWKGFFRSLYKTVLCTLGGLVIIAPPLFIFVYNNFNESFVLFHEMIFTNDLWLLDPATSLLINIVPQEFFVDITVRLIIVFAILVLVALGISSFFYIRDRRRA